MQGAYRWLETLPAPLPRPTSYDPAGPPAAALHARLTQGAMSILRAPGPHDLRVRHWWAGAAPAPANLRGRRRTEHVLALLTADGAVLRVYGAPSVDHWIDFVMDLDPATLKAGPLAVTAAAQVRPRSDLPEWFFCQKESTCPASPVPK